MVLSFKASRPFTLGIELEVQIIDRENKNLSARSDEALKILENTAYRTCIKPEITKGMLEINSNIHTNYSSLLQEMNQIRAELLEHTKELNLLFSGGGLHPFQMWNTCELYPTENYRTAQKKYGYLVKMFTVFGMHIHIGCANPSDALYLTHAMAKYTPHFIALSASSPFCQGIDTEFCSARSNIVNLFPVSGMPPLLLDWEEFCCYLTKMAQLPLIENVNNFYWDIRPKAELGTVELRVCDAPLSIEKAASIAAFAQSLAHYLLHEKPSQLLDYNKHDLYRYNRFQASKLGLDAFLLDPSTFQEYSLRDDLLDMCKKIEPHSHTLGNSEAILSIATDIANKKNDATWLKRLQSEGEKLEDIVYLATQLFAGNINQGE